MVRLKREIEGLKRDEKKVLPGYLAQGVGLDVLNEHALSRTMALPFDRGGRALVVSPSELTVRALLECSAHVSVVENEPERLQTLMNSLQDVEMYELLRSIPSPTRKFRLSGAHLT